MAVKEFKLPDPGEGLTEAEIVTWNVKVGDTVKVNDIVVEIETAKSLVELPVPFAGTVTALLVSEGDTVEVGTPIISVDTARRRRHHRAGRPGAGRRRARHRGLARRRRWRPRSVAAAAEEEIEEGKIGGTTSTGRTAVLVGYGVKQTEAKRRPRKAGAAARAAPTHSPGASSRRPTSPSATGRAGAPRAPSRAVGPRGWRRARWPSRRSASGQGPRRRPRQVAGSGEGGIITRADVEAHAAGGAQPATHGAAGAPRAPASGIPGTGLHPRWRARDAHPDQGRPQDDRPGDGRQRVHGAARHRVGHHRRHRHDGARRAAQEGPRVQGRQGHAAAGAGQGDVPSRSAATPRSTRPGTRPPRRSWSRTTSTSASPPPPRAG